MPGRLFAIDSPVAGFHGRGIRPLSPARRSRTRLPGHRFGMAPDHGERDLGSFHNPPLEEESRMLGSSGPLPRLLGRDTASGEISQRRAV